MLRLWLLRLSGGLLKRCTHPQPDSPRTILYIKPDHLGDLVLATPVLRVLRERFPGARIVALVGPWSRVVLNHSTDIDLLLTCPFPGFSRSPVPASTSRGPVRLCLALHARVQPYLALLRYGLLLRRSRIDAAIIGRDDHWWGALLALVAGIPLRIGFGVPECRPLLSYALPWNPRDHVTAQGLRLVEYLATPPAPSRVVPGAGESAQALPYSYTPAATAQAWVRNWLEQAGLEARRLIVIHPGTGGASKLWAAAKWAQVAETLTNEGWQVVLTGGPGEEALVAAVAAHLVQPAIQLVGQTTVDQLAALLAQAQVVLGVDSGPLHIAAAVGTPSLHLFGPGDPGRFGPWGPSQRHRVLRARLWCSPCGVFAACPRGYSPAPCMDAIEADEVVSAARALAAL